MNNGMEMVMNNLRMVILDCDGTIVDSQKAIVRIMEETFEIHNLIVPERNKILFGVGLELSTGIERLLPENHNLDIIELCKTYKKLATRYRDKNNFDEPLYPDAEKTIRRLHSDGWLLGIATGKSSLGLEHVLSSHDMSDLFITKQTSDCAAGKPNPEMLYNAMSETGVTAEAIFMVGDTTYDICMAVNAGTNAIGVSWGYHSSAELLHAGAKIVVNSYFELFNFLNKITENK
jgi:phosphoglycolate phosphatase